MYIDTCIHMYSYTQGQIIPSMQMQHDTFFYHRSIHSIHDHGDPVCLISHSCCPRQSPGCQYATSSPLQHHPRRHLHHDLHLLNSLGCVHLDPPRHHSQQHCQACMLRQFHDIHVLLYTRNMLYKYKPFHMIHPTFVC